MPKNVQVITFKEFEAMADTHAKMIFPFERYEEDQLGIIRSYTFVPLSFSPSAKEVIVKRGVK